MEPDAQGCDDGESKGGKMLDRVLSSQYYSKYFKTLYFVFTQQYIHVWPDATFV